MSACMSFGKKWSDDRYLIGTFPVNGWGSDGRLDYLFHILDLMDYTPPNRTKQSKLDGPLLKETSAQDNPLRVVDM